MKHKILIRVNKEQEWLDSFFDEDGGSMLYPS